MIGSFEARLAQRGLYRTREGRFVESTFIAQRIPTDPPDLSPKLLVGIARHRGSSAVEQPRRGGEQGRVGTGPRAKLDGSACKNSEASRKAWVERVGSISLRLVSSQEPSKTSERTELREESLVLRERWERVAFRSLKRVVSRQSGAGEARRGRDSSVEDPSFPSIGPRQSSLRAHAGTRRRRSRQRDASVADHPG